MSTCRFIRTNLAANATILNGTAGTPTPPARTEVAPFVMERALNGDRRSLWRLGAENGVAFPFGYQIDLDFGANVTLSAISLHGLSCPGGEIVSINVGVMNSYPTTFYDQIDSVSVSGTLARDAGIVFAARTKRYWYIWIEATAAPVIGRVVCGAIYDLGMAPNPGSESSPFRNRLEQAQQDGSIHTRELGYPGRDFQLSFDPVLTAQRDLVLALGELQGSVVYFDTEGQCFEVLLRGARVVNNRRSPDVHGVSVQMTRLP